MFVNLCRVPLHVDKFELWNICCIWDTIIILAMVNIIPLPNTVCFVVPTGSLMFFLRYWTSGRFLSLQTLRRSFPIISKSVKLLLHGSV